MWATREEHDHGSANQFIVIDILNKKCWLAKTTEERECNLGWYSFPYSKFYFSMFKSWYLDPYISLNDFCGIV